MNSRNSQYENHSNFNTPGPGISLLKRQQNYRSQSPKKLSPSRKKVQVPDANESKIHLHGDISALIEDASPNPFSGYGVPSRAISLDPPGFSPDQKPTTARVKK